MAFINYVIGGVVVGGIIGTSLAAYEIARDFVPEVSEMSSDTIYLKYAAPVMAVLSSLVFGAVVGGVPGAAVGAASGAIVGGAKKGLEAVIGLTRAKN